LEPAKAKAADPLIGKLFGGCRIERLIGRGGMGAVYLATQLNLDRPVAVKVIAPDILDDDESLQRLSREAKIVANLSHPNIVQLHFTGKEFNYPYLVMEYVDGQSLGVLLRSIGKISVSAACDVILQCGFALEAAAAVGVVHRDIKPDNILITPDGRVKVTDFGLARRSNDSARLTLTGQSLGTPHYMSPEQCEGHSMDIRSDIYSLGITFWQCLAGFLPFDGETPFAILMKQVHEKLPDIRVVSPDVPKEVAEIIAAMTAKDLMQRMGEPGEIVRGLKKYLGGPDVKREKLKATSRTADGVSPADLSAPFDSDPAGIGAQSSQAYRETNVGMQALNMPLPGGPAKPGTGPASPAPAQSPSPVAPAPPAATPSKTGRRRFLIAASAGVVLAGIGIAGLLLTRKKDKPPPTMMFVLRRTIIGHTNAVKALHFSGNGELLASGGADRTVRLWRETNGLQIHSLTGHGKMVTSVQFGPDEDVLASGGLDWSVRLWDPKTGKELKKLGPPSHTNTVTALAFSADGETLASGSMDQSVMLWDWRKGTYRRVFKGHSGMVTCLGFRSDDKVLASGGADRRINLWVLENPREFETCYPQDAMVTALAYSPDGQVLATAGQDQTIHILNAGTRAVLKKLEGHEKSVLSLAFSSDSKYLASGSADGSVRLWDPDKGVEIAMAQGDSMVWTVCFNPNGLLLAAGTQDGKIHYYEFTKITK
jgi:serine/threonine protein kinase/WD40 repeat protein